MQVTPGAPQSRLPIVVIAVAIVLALIGIAGIASGGADKPSHKVSSRGSTSTTEDLGGFGGGDTGTTLTTVAGAGGGSVTTSPTTVKGSTNTTAKGTTGTTSPDAVGDCPAPAPSNSDPGPAQAPAIGTYTFVSCTDSKDTSDVKVAAGQSGNGVTRRMVTESAGEGGMSQTATEAYGPNGVVDEVWTIKAGVGEYKCDWNPDLLLFPPQLSVGKTWNVDSSCTITTPQGTFTLHLTGNAKISGRVSVNVGGTTVNAWVVDATVQLALPGQTVNQTLHEHWDPVHGVNVYRNVHASSSQGSTDRVDRLKSLTPK